MILLNASNAAAVAAAADSNVCWSDLLVGLLYIRGSTDRNGWSTLLIATVAFSLQRLRCVDRNRRTIAQPLFFVSSRLKLPTILPSATLTQPAHYIGGLLSSMRHLFWLCCYIVSQVINRFSVQFAVVLRIDAIDWRFSFRAIYCRNLRNRFQNIIVTKSVRVTATESTGRLNGQQQVL